MTNAVTAANIVSSPNGMVTRLRKDRALDSEYLDSVNLEQLTGTPASTWRYWAHIGSGPPSFKIGRRRVWKKTTVLQWLADQEKAATA